MPLSSPFVLLVGSGTYLDLRKVSGWWDTSPQTSPPSVQVRMIDTPRTAIQVQKDIFEAQMTLAVAAGS